MRFSLRTLLLMFPALAVLYGASYYVSGNIYWHTYAHGVDEREERKIGRLHEFVNLPNSTISPTKNGVYVWLSQALPTAETSANIHARLEYMEVVDGWNSAYRCVKLDAENKPTDENEFHVIGIYSVGEDGLSVTQGNDADDLNSWAFDRAYYQKRRYERDLWEQRINALWLMPVIAVVLGLCWAMMSFVWLLLRRSRSYEWERSIRRR